MWMGGKETAKTIKDTLAVSVLEYVYVLINVCVSKTIYDGIFGGLFHVLRQINKGRALSPQFGGYL